MEQSSKRQNNIIIDFISKYIFFNNDNYTKNKG